MLGIVSSTSSLKFAQVSGTRQAPAWSKLSADSLKIPDEGDEGQILLKFESWLRDFFVSNQVESISLLKAVGGQQGGPAEIRVKIEGLIQLVAASLKVPLRLMVPNSLRNEEKRFDIYTGTTPEERFTEGKKFKSKELKDATLVAWAALESSV